MSSEGLACFHRACSCQSPSLLCHAPRLHFLSWLDSTPLSVWTALCLPVHRVMDVWVGSPLAALNNAAVNMVIKVSMESLGSVLLGICICMYVYVDVCVRVDLLGHVVAPCLTFCKTTELVSTVAAPFYIPNNSTWGVQFLPIFASSCYLPPPPFFKVF